MTIDNRFYIRILSPVHIGCDEVYEPMGFTIDERSGKLTVFDPLDFFRSLNPQDREQYAAISRKGTVQSLIELYGFMKGKKFGGREVTMTKVFVEHYRQTLSLGHVEGNTRRMQRELNNFMIARTAFHANRQLPYIPGSAIKGAMRTAYLNRLAERTEIQVNLQDRGAAQVLEK